MYINGWKSSNKNNQGKKKAEGREKNFPTVPQHFIQTEEKKKYVTKKQRST